MDWWSFLFILSGSGAIIYFGLAIMWAIRYLMGDLVDRTFVAHHYKGLMMALAIMVVCVIALYVAHVAGIITMWEVGYALAR